MLAWALIALWGSLHLVRLLCVSSRPARSILDRRKSSSAASASTWCTLGLVSLHVETTALNALPKAVLRPWTRRQRASAVLGDGPVALARWWELGAVAAVLSLVVAQAVLAWATVKSCAAMYATLGAKSPVGSLAKRSIASDEPAQSLSSSLVLRPAIPGLTQPWSALPSLLSALIVSSVLHELGHALAGES